MPREAYQQAFGLRGRGRIDMRLAIDKELLMVGNLLQKRALAERQDEVQRPLVGQQPFAVCDEPMKRERVRVACLCPLLIGAFQRIDKERRIRDDAIVGAPFGLFVGKAGEVGVDYAYLPGKRGTCYILAGLQAGIGIDVDRVDEGVGPLGEHEGDESRPAADVEDALRPVASTPRPDEDAIRPHFHDTFVVPDGKLFEFKVWI